MNSETAIERELLRLANSADAYGYGINLPGLSNIVGASDAEILKVLKRLVADKKLLLEKAESGRRRYNPQTDNDATFFYEGSFWLISPQYETA
jgi:hypothetical protein